MEKLKSIFRLDSNKKVIAILMVMCMMFAMSCCFADEGTSATSPDFSPIITALSNVITPTMLITIIATTIGVGAAFVLMWFGVRKLKAAFVKGFTKGKL